MEKNQGFIKLWRSFEDREGYLGEKFCENMALVDMYFIANFKPSILNIRGNKLAVGIGQFAYSEEALEKRWNWSRTKVRKFIKDQVKNGELIQQKTPAITLTTLVNYLESSIKDTTENTAEDTVESTTEDTAENTAEDTVESTTEGTVESTAEDTHPKKERKKEGKKERRKEDTLVAKKPPAAYSLCVEFWLNQFHEDWTFGAVQGKAMKSFLVKIEKLLKTAGKEITPEAVRETFEVICTKLPEWFEDKDIHVLNQSFNTIIAQIKNNENEEKPRIDSNGKRISKYAPRRQVSK